MPYHGDERNLSLAIGGNVRSGGQYGLLTNTNVAAANTNAGLQSAIDTKVATAHGDVYPAAQRIKRAIALGKNATFDMEDADINALTTVEGLADLTANTDGSVLILNQLLD